MDSRSTGVAYLLLALSVFGVAGLHRFYLGRGWSGLIWLLTWGLFGIGTLIDLFYLPDMVALENRRLGLDREGDMLPSGPRPRPLPAPTPPLARLPAPTTEQSILRLAHENDGRVTVAMVALNTGLSLRRARKALERLVKDGHAERDVSTEGVYLYVFRGLRSSEPFDLDAV